MKLINLFVGVALALGVVLRFASQWVGTDKWSKPGLITSNPSRTLSSIA